MFIVGLFSWWYGSGWKQCAIDVRSNLASLYDYFSFDLLTRTLFSPFRQISAGEVRGPLGVQARAFLDRLISRMIGAIIRMTLIVVGVIALIVAAAIGVLRIVTWPFVPVIPVVLVSFAIIGWVPWKI